MYLDNQEALENSWARTLQSNGFYEVMNNSLTAEKNVTPEAVKLLNPLSGDLAFMRTSLLQGLLENTIYNINRKNPDIKFFELGKIYQKRESYTERKQLAILVSGREVRENWLEPKSATNFYYLKGYVQLLLDRLGFTFVEKSLVDNRFADAIELLVGEKVMARIGKVSSQLLKSFDIEQDCYYAEIEIEVVESLRNKDNFKFVDIPKFNKIRRDLALLVDKNVTYSELYEAVMKEKSPILKSVNLFDVYEGKNLPEGKKSYALSFELLNEEKTLEDKEITEVMDKIIKIFETKFQASLR